MQARFGGMHRTRQAPDPVYAKRNMGGWEPEHILEPKWQAGYTGQTNIDRLSTSNQVSQIYNSGTLRKTLHKTNRKPI